MNTKLPPLVTPAFAKRSRKYIYDMCVDSRRLVPLGFVCFEGWVVLTRGDASDEETVEYRSYGKVRKQLLKYLLSDAMVEFSVDDALTVCKALRDRVSGAVTKRMGVVFHEEHAYFYSPRNNHYGLDALCPVALDEVDRLVIDLEILWKAHQD